MRAGSLRHRVVIESPAVATGSVGGQSITWSTFATIWASVEPLRGSEYLSGQQLTNKVSAKITSRYRDDITTAMRAVWDGHTYDIVDVVNVRGRGEQLEIMCQEVL